MSGTPGYPPPPDPYRPAGGPPAYGPSGPGQAPGFYGPPPGYGYGFVPPRPDHPRATPAMVVGIIGLAGGVACGLPLLASPVAWWFGAQAKKEIDASGGQLGGRGQAQAGFVLGLIGSILLMLGVALLVVAVLVGVFEESSGY